LDHYEPPSPSYSVSQRRPESATWQRDLSICHDKVGDVERDQGDLIAALDRYKTAFGIKERLANSAPENAHGSATSHWVSSVWPSSRQDSARARMPSIYSGRGRDIIAALKARTPNGATVSDDLARFDAHLAEVEQLTAHKAEGIHSLRPRVSTR